MNLSLQPMAGSTRLKHPSQTPDQGTKDLSSPKCGSPDLNKHYQMANIFSRGVAVQTSASTAKFPRLPVPWAQQVQADRVMAACIKPSNSSTSMKAPIPMSAPNKSNTSWAWPCRPRPGSLPSELSFPECPDGPGGGGESRAMVALVKDKQAITGWLRTELTGDRRSCQVCRQFCIYRSRQDRPREKQPFTACPVVSGKQKQKKHPRTSARDARRRRVAKQLFTRHDELRIEEERHRKDRDKPPRHPVQRLLGGLS